MLLSVLTYNNFKEVHTFIFTSLSLINFHVIEMQGRVGKAGRREEGVREEEIELRTDERDGEWRRWVEKVTWIKIKDGKGWKESGR